MLLDNDLCPDFSCEYFKLGRLIADCPECSLHAPEEPEKAETDGDIFMEKADRDYERKNDK